VGTSSGLNAFDRRTERFTRYRRDPANPHSLSDNTVNAIYEDRSNVLWIGTGSGLNRLDRATGQFTVYHHDPDDPHTLGHDTVRAITEDRTGTLWVGTLNGLSRFDRATATFITYRHDPANLRSLSHDVVWDIREDRAGKLWVGTDGGGLSRFEPATNDFTRYRHDPANVDSVSGDRVAGLFEDASGALWISTFGAGLSVLDAARQRFTKYRHDATVPASLSNDYLAQIISDRSGLIWIGTQGSGVDIHDPRLQAFTLFNHNPRRAESLASDLVVALTEDENGTLWIGTQDRGLDRFDRRTGRVVHYPPDATNPRRLGHEWVSALQLDRNGVLWVGTYGGGLYSLDPQSGRFTRYRHDPADPRSLSHDTISDLHMDRSGALWIGMRGGGLGRFDPARRTFSAYRYDRADPRSLSSDLVWAIVEDPQGLLWIGTGSGLNRLELATGTITRYHHDPQNPHSLGDDNIWALHVDRSGVLWVGTLGGGLDRFDRATGTFTHYRERDGLASDRVVSILEDGDADDSAVGNLWIATGRGLSKLDRDRKTFHAYGKTDGLPITEYNRGGHTTRQGEILMGTVHGLIAFDPDAVRDYNDVPTVVFTNFLIANHPVAIGMDSPLRQAIDLTDSIELTYVDRVISFEFAALNYRAPRQTRYRYKLEGFDTDWTTVGSRQRLVTYTNLAPRKYVFRVTAANGAGAWDATGRAVALVVRPPWWATWWFRTLAFALTAGAATGLYAWRVSSLKRRRRELEVEIDERTQVEKQLRSSHQQIEDLAGRLITAQEAERTRIARELHDDVGQRVASLSIALSALKRKVGHSRLEGTDDEFSTLQREAMALSKDLRDLSHELHPGALEHVGLVEALETRCEELNLDSNFNARVDVTEGWSEVPYDIAVCLYRVAQEALRNVARHAHATTAQISLARQNGQVVMRVTDDGRGFETNGARHRGLGLISMDERVRMLGGTFQVQPGPHKGTVVVASLPLGERS
jgi:signal transduction histidine kinase/ligand-binding sensor domain-containing protein